MGDDSCLFFNILILQQEEVVNQMQMSVLTLKKFLLVKEMKSGTLHPGALLTHHEQWRRFHCTMKKKLPKDSFSAFVCFYFGFL